MRRGDQLLGIGSLALLEARGERVGAAEDAVTDGQLALAASQVAADDRRQCWTTLRVALAALTDHDDYESGVTWVIGLGGDTDTNAAVAGALLGCRDGAHDIPARWLEALRERERVERAARSLARRSSGAH